jgi:hypothetical protein
MGRPVPNVRHISLIEATKNKALDTDTADETDEADCPVRSLERNQTGSCSVSFFLISF